MTVADWLTQRLVGVGLSATGDILAAASAFFALQAWRSERQSRRPVLEIAATPLARGVVKITGHVQNFAHESVVIKSVEARAPAGAQLIHAIRRGSKGFDPYTGPRVALDLTLGPAGSGRGDPQSSPGGDSAALPLRALLPPSARGEVSLMMIMRWSRNRRVHKINTQIARAKLVIIPSSAPD